MNISRRLEKIEAIRKQKTAPVIHVMERPNMSQDEWMEIQQKTGFMGNEYPALVRELLTKRGDGSEVKYSEYLNRLEAQV